MKKTRLSSKRRIVGPLKFTSVKSVLGCLNYKGPKKTLKDMETAIIKGIKKIKT